MDKKKVLLDAPASTHGPTRSSKLKGSASVNLIRVYDAGGGSGASHLTFEALRQEQVAMYKRTYNITPSEIANMEQEKRQVSIVEKKINITVTVARQDFPSVSTSIAISYPLSAPQSEWGTFLSSSRKHLYIEFIEEIIDRMTDGVVHRILALRDGCTQQNWITIKYTYFRVKTIYITVNIRIQLRLQLICPNNRAIYVGETE